MFILNSVLDSVALQFLCSSLYHITHKFLFEEACTQICTVVYMILYRNSSLPESVFTLISNCILVLVKWSRNEFVVRGTHLKHC